MKVRSDAIKLAVFAIVTLVLTGILGSVIANVSFAKAERYSGIFTDATGVSTGDDVRLVGVKVGHITSVSLVNNTQAKIGFTIDQPVPIYADAVFALRYENLVGQRFLEIQEAAGTRALLTPGTTVGVAQTLPALDLTALFNGFKPLFAALQPDQINTLSLQIVQTLQGEGGTVTSLLTSTASLTSTLADKDAVIGNVIDNLGTVLSTVDSRDTQLTALITQFQQLMTGLASDKQSISDALPKLSDLVSATSGLVSQVRVPLAGDITNLQTLATGVASTSQSLDQLITSLPTKLNELQRTADYGSWFNFYLCGADVQLSLLGSAITLNSPVTAPATTPEHGVHPVKPFRERNTRVMAVVGLTGTGLVLAVAFNTAKLPFIGDGKAYHAEFTEAGGLTTGQDVRVAGIKVGSVTDISLKGNQVDVTFHAKGVTLGSDTSAAIKIKTLLGANYLEIDPAGTGKLTTAIPTSRTTAAFNLVPAVSQLTTTIGDIDTTQLADAFTTLADTFRTSPPEVQQTLDGLSRLSQTISSRDDEITSLLQHADSVTGTVAANDTQIKQLIDDTNQVLVVLDQRSTVIDNLLTGTAQLSTQLTGLVKDNQADLTPALQQLGTVTAILSKDHDDLGQSISGLNGYLKAFTNLTGTGGYFDTTIKAPSGLTVCDNASADPLASVVDPVLSEINSAAGGGAAPCLPISGSTP